MSLFGLVRNQRTFRPKKSAPSGSKGAQLRKHIDATLCIGNLREAVRLLPGEDLNEWLAVNTVDFFNQVNLLYGTLTEFCTAENCPAMTAGPKYEYRWADDVKIKKPIEVAAPKDVEYLMDWIEAQLDDESIFPQELGMWSHRQEGTRAAARADRIHNCSLLMSICNTMAVEDLGQLIEQSCWPSVSVLMLLSLSYASASLVTVSFRSFCNYVLGEDNLLLQAGVF